tara:strand:+ start:811 stop:1281 length:471 start_codon:yes stop_codon:yes gene_type:complete
MTSYESLKKELNDPNQIFLRGKFIDYWLKQNTKIVEKNGKYDLDQIGKSAKTKYEEALKDFSTNLKTYKNLIDEIEVKVSDRLYDASNNISNISKSIYEKKQIIKDTENEKTKYSTSKPFIKDHYIRKNYTYVNLGLTTIGVGALFYILFRQIKME